MSPHAYIHWMGFIWNHFVCWFTQISFFKKHKKVYIYKWMEIEGCKNKVIRRQHHYIISHVNIIECKLKRKATKKCRSYFWICTFLLLDLYCCEKTKKEMFIIHCYVSECYESKSSHIFLTETMPFRIPFFACISSLYANV